jgi:hypothetical protein
VYQDDEVDPQGTQTVEPDVPPTPSVPSDDVVDVPKDDIDVPHTYEDNIEEEVNERKGPTLEDLMNQTLKKKE